MEQFLKKTINGCFYLLFLLTPLIVYPKTSEIFEFNKMVFVYFITIVLSGLWLIRMVFEKRLIFRRTIMDIPLVVFVASQTLSTLFSLDPRTSYLGYYSRFNGGLLSTISYSLLFWMFVSNMDGVSTRKSIKFIFISSLISCVWAIFEHFGHSFSCLIFPGFGTFDVSCWVQDVQNRVYSTFGQPNWLAAWLVALIPLTWGYAIYTVISGKDGKTDLLKFSRWLAIFTVFFTTLIFTKSRSGILAFGIEFVIFWSLVAVSSRRIERIFHIGPKNHGVVPVFVWSFITILVIVLLFGTPWTPNIENLLTKGPQITATPTVTGPALETGGTESGKIRSIVWKGAVDIWKHYPIFGSGVETFTYSYYQYRPKEHNLVSEWDYLYNKAHNEYLNFAATTGSVGLLTYLALIMTALYLLYTNSFPEIKTYSSGESDRKVKPEKADIIILDINYTAIALLAGYIAILITNFFGFSVVPVSLLFFLLPALIIGLLISPEEVKPTTPGATQRSTAAIIALLAVWGIYLVYKYWNADMEYARGKNYFDAGNYPESIKVLSELVNKSPNEPLYWDKLADASTALARAYSKDKGNENLIIQLSQSAISASNQAVTMSPANVNFKRSMASNLVSLSFTDPGYLQLAKKTLEDAIKQSPTDPKLFYNLSYTYLNAGDYDNAIKYMEQAIDLKSNYEKARYAVALMYEDKNEKGKARENLEYILKYINPQNTEAQRELNEIDK